MNLTLEDINSISIREYIREFGTLFEHSPWVAEAAFRKRPFTSFEQMHEQMTEVVQRAGDEQKLILLREHPDLGSRLSMSEYSVHEQKGAGLNEMTEEKRKELLILNHQYSEKFGFPFIIAVKGKTAEQIIEVLKERLEHDRTEEFRIALEQVYFISWYRLKSWIEQNMAEETV